MDLSILEGWSGPPGTLIDLLFEAGDLLPELFYLVLEVPLPASHPGVAGLQGVAEAVGPAHGPPAPDAQGGAKPPHRRGAPRARGWRSGRPRAGPRGPGSAGTCQARPRRCGPPSGRLGWRRRRRR